MPKIIRALLHGWSMMTVRNSTDSREWRAHREAKCQRAREATSKCQRAREAICHLLPRDRCLATACSVKLWIIGQVFTIISSRAKKTSTHVTRSQVFWTTKCATGSLVSLRLEIYRGQTPSTETQITLKHSKQKQTLSKNKMGYSRICITPPTDSEKHKCSKHEKNKK